jgi:hypothetical protein
MSTKTDKNENNIENQEYLMDSSIDDAKWLLASVATLGLLVMSLGLIASSLAS